VFLPRHDNVVLDPVAALEVYLAQTEKFRSDSSVFLSLKRPYTALSAASVAMVLENSIELAGLKSQGYTAKSFRPTGATRAIDMGVEPKIVQKVGRWKCQEVFFDHSVHSKTPGDFTSNII
jgi:site-specific recombinase XerD